MSSIGSIGSTNQGLMMQGMRQRPDTAKMAANLFSQLDISKQGYLQKADLQTAFNKISSTSDTSNSASSVDALFSALDTDSNGQVTKQEFTDNLTKLQNDLEQQFHESRAKSAMQTGGAGGMNSMGGMPPPPPPPPSGEGPTLTEDELSSVLSQIGMSDSSSDMMANILNNFDQADTDGDGKVSFKEAMTYDQANPATGGTSGAAISGTDSSSGTSSSNDLNQQLMQQIMKLVEAYGSSSESGSAIGTSLFTTA
jgi:Ca2+-binding EF-hand superfamily protein